MKNYRSTGEDKLFLTETENTTIQLKQKEEVDDAQVIILRNVCFCFTSGEKHLDFQILKSKL